MRVGIAGKGGVGKTTISAVLARTLARRGHRVIAVDCDSDPHLAMNAGIGAETIDAMRPLIERGGKDGPIEAEAGATPVQLMSTHGIEGPDGVTFIQASRISKPGGG
ncbi:MAG: AAA family ATPase [Acidimicrobiales bacterium]